MEDSSNTSVAQKPKKKDGGGTPSFLGNISSTTVHIVVEALAFVVLYLHFNSKFSKLTKELQELREDFDEQQETLQRHEEILKKLVESRQQQAKSPVQLQPQQLQPQQLQPQQLQPQQLQPQQLQPQQLQPQQLQPQQRPVFVTPSITEIKPEDLDAELQDELTEMNKGK
jgi:hypothetical protein